MLGDTIPATLRVPISSTKILSRFVVHVRADSNSVRRRMNLRWGVMPFRMSFGAQPEDNIIRAFKCDYGVEWPQCTAI